MGCAKFNETSALKFKNVVSMAKSKSMFSFLGGSVKEQIFSLVLILLLCVVAYFGIKKLVMFFKSMQFAEKNELNDLLVSGQKLSYPESQYKVFADKLYVAMKGLGTDRDAVYNVFNAMVNKADLMKLITSFGVRDGETLAEWMNGETFLSIDNINKILSNKGIDYTF
jgi:hypothetical protein